MIAKITPAIEKIVDAYLQKKTQTLSGSSSRTEHKSFYLTHNKQAPKPTHSFDSGSLRSESRFSIEPTKYLLFGESPYLSGKKKNILL